MMVCYPPKYARLIMHIYRGSHDSHRETIAKHSWGLYSGARCPEPYKDNEQYFYTCLLRRVRSRKEPWI